MIEIKNINKKFDENEVLKNINFVINENETFGLIGTNGAGKSTILRLIATILNPDSGNIIIDGEDVHKNPYIKKELVYISDEQYYFLNADINMLIKYYKLYYDKFDEDKVKKIFKDIGFDLNKKIKNFSKGMKKQVFIILALCANTKYVLLDETFDGLDPVMRQVVKTLIANEMLDRKITPIIASHNLRELEDITNNICLLHKGKVILSNNLDDMKLGMHRVQLILADNSNEKLLDNLDIIKKDTSGKLITMTIKGKKEEIEKVMKDMNCLYSEMLPLTLEEMFLDETEGVGYDVKSILS